MSPLCPPSGFPPHLALIWPLIWVQILALRVYVRATWGKGTQYHWSVTPWGHVFIASVDWVPGQDAPVWIEPAPHPNARIAAALNGDLMMPGALRHLPEYTPEHPGIVRGVSAFIRGVFGLPLPVP